MDDGPVARAQTRALDRGPGVDKIGDGAFVADVDVLAEMVGGDGSAVEFDDGELAGVLVLNPVETAQAVEAGDGADVGGDFSRRVRKYWRMQEGPKRPGQVRVA